MKEPILDADLPIIDSHHHQRDRRAFTPLQAGDHPFLAAIDDVRLYLLDELLADLNTGHNVKATVFLECGAFYRAGGPVEFKPVGETEFANGIAAMSASGIYGDRRICAGIVGYADLLLGDKIAPILEAHIVAGAAVSAACEILRRLTPIRPF
jgi:L-fuconolactonase